MLFSLLSSKLTFISLSFCFLIIACSQSLYIPSVETTSNIQDIEALTLGRKLYIKNCGSCHNLYRPEKFSAEHWTMEMVEMKEEAKINDHEAGLILKYLTYSKIDLNEAG